MACGRDADDRTEASREDHRESKGLLLVLTPEQDEAARLVVVPAGSSVEAPRLKVTGEVAYDADRVAKVQPRAAGRLVEIRADLGSRVGKGDVLALVDSPDLGEAEAAYVKGSAEHEAALKALQRARALREGEAISLGELQQREAQEVSARADLLYSGNHLRLLGLDESAIADLGAQASAGPSPQGGSDPRVNPVFPVRSPIAGSVTERGALPGEMITPETSLFTVADLSRVWVFFDVFEKDLGSVRTGLAVIFISQSYPGRSFEGKVDFVGPQIGASSRTARVRATLPNPEGALRPGMFVTGEIVLDTAGTRPAEVVVPASAVVDLEGRPHVFVREAERTYRAVPVQVSGRDGETVRLEGGVSPRQQVVVEGAFTLKAELLKDRVEED